MPWFRDVPTRILVTKLSYLPAAQAIFEAEASQGEMPDASHGEREGDDWGAVAVLHLAKLQLEQMEYLVHVIIESDGNHERLTRDEISKRLDARISSIDLPENFEVDYEVACIKEGLDLLQALRDHHQEASVTHAFAPDGSIALTVGPELPSCAALGIKGSPGGELEDEPDHLFNCARDSTEAAAVILDAYRSAS